MSVLFKKHLYIVPVLMFIFSILLTSCNNDSNTSLNIIDMPTQNQDLASGKCGDNAVWTFDNNGIFTVSGSGAMYSYDISNFNNNPPNVTPWQDILPKIKKIVIENGITSVGSASFYDCPILEEIVVAESVKTIESDAFSFCPSLKQLTLPDGVEIIGKSAFDYCENLTSINFPNSLKTIQSCAFRHCATLTEIHIPAGVTEIGGLAFGDNSNKSSLVEAFFYGDMPKITEDGTSGEIFPKSVTVYYQKGSSGWYGDEWYLSPNIKYRLMSFRDECPYISDAINYKKSVNYNYYYDDSYYPDHFIILPKINISSYSATAFNNKIYDRVSFYIDALKNNSEDSALYYIDYIAAEVNGYIGIRINYKIGWQMSEYLEFYSGYYYDINNDRELTYEEYLDALEVDFDKLTAELDKKIGYYDYENDTNLHLTSKKSDNMYIDCCLFSPKCTIYTFLQPNTMSGTSPYYGICNNLLDVVHIY